MQIVSKVYEIHSILDGATGKNERIVGNAWKVLFYFILFIYLYIYIYIYIF